MMNFKYILKKSTRKTLSIEINSYGTILIKAPKNISENQIEEILLKKSNWIENKISEIKNRNNKSWSFDENFKIPLLGEEFPIKFFLSNSRKNFVKFLNNEFNFFIEEEFLKNETLKREICLKLLKAFYKEFGKDYLEKRTRELENIIGVKCNAIRVKDVKSIWGSCSSKNNINYNLRLILMDKELIDYVVVHELCHLIHRNHSKSFWNEVEKYIPNYKERKDKLKRINAYYI